MVAHLHDRPEVNFYWFDEPAAVLDEPLIEVKAPVSVNKNALAVKALSMMNNRKITSLCVHDSKNRQKTIGVIHIHTILQSNIS